jgi:dolichol-phosphate mannosyltransferase
VNWISGLEIPVDTGDFRNESPRRSSLLQLREHHRVMNGLFAWIGFRQDAYRYERDPRFAGASRFQLSAVMEFFRWKD